MTTNSDVLRKGYEAFARQDIPAVLALFDPDIVWYAPDTVRNGGTYKGPDEVLSFFMTLPENFQELKVNARQFVEQGDTVVVLGNHVGKAANGDFDIPFVHVWTLRDGKATSFTEHFDTVRMNQAIG
jgi:ketosteroid isomerase-like protein